jgi:predicted transcriptional regulator of viral defense system
MALAAGVPSVLKAVAVIPPVSVSVAPATGPLVPQSQILLNVVRKQYIFFLQPTSIEMNTSIEKEMLSRIMQSSAGDAFSPKDFSDLGSRQAVDVALHRLEARGAIRRILRGVYDRPKIGELTGRPISPDIWSVAQTIARKNGWKIVPSGETALNALGLSTQMPGSYLFFTDGQNKHYRIGNGVIEFRHRMPKDIPSIHGKCGLIIQALKALGKDRIDSTVIGKLELQLTLAECRELLDTARYMTGWINDYVKKICRKVNDAENRPDEH